MTDITKKYENSGVLIEWCHIPTTDMQDPERSTVRFKAFLTGFSEQYSSDWNQEQVFGRMDPIESFQATRRAIQLAWTVIAYDQAEAFENMKKVSKLTKFLYPTYAVQGQTFIKSGFGIMSASPLLRLKFMNLIQSTSQKGATEYSNQFATAPGIGGQNSYGPVQTLGLLGRTDGFQVNHELDDGFFMIPGPVSVPKRISLSCVFYPLHEHGMGWNSTTKRFFSEEFPYGMSDGLTSTAGTSQVGPAGSHPLNDAEGMVIDEKDGKAPTEVVNPILE